MTSKEGTLKFGQVVPRPQMPQWHGNPTVSHLFATFLHDCRPEISQWYSMKKYHSEIPSLSSLINTSEENLQSILNLCGLGFTTKSGKLCLNVNKIEAFFTTFDLADVCEITRSKRNTKSPQLFIRIGTNDKEGTPDPGVFGWGPRIRNICQYRTKFRTGLLSCAPLFQPEVSNIAQASNEETQVSEETDDDDISYTNNLLIVRVVQRLLPLLINTEYLLQPNLLHTMPPIDQIESTLLEITQEIQQHKADELTAVLGTEKLPLSPTTKYNTNFCPTMRRFGIPLDDARIQQALLTDLHQWNKKQNGTTTLHTNLGDNKMSSFVLIPSSKSFSRLRENERRSKWLSNMLEAIGGPGRHDDSLLNMLLFIGQSETYKHVWDAAVETNGVPIPKMDETTTFAVQSMCNMNKTQMRMLRRCLRAEIGSTLFSTEHSIKQFFGSESIVIQTGNYKYGSQRIHWSYKSLKETLLLWLESNIKKASVLLRLMS